MISIGVDPGLACAITWLDMSRPREPAYIDSTVLECGHKVALAKPRVYRGAQRRVQTEETVMGPGDWWRLFGYVSELFAELKRHPAAERGGVILTIEGVERVTPRKNLAQSRSQATALNLASRIGAEIAGHGRCVIGPERVQYVTEDEWREALIGHGHENEDRAVAEAIARLVSGWPKKSNAHQRDAAGAGSLGWLKWTAAGSPAPQKGAETWIV